MSMLNLETPQPSPSPQSGLAPKPLGDPLMFTAKLLTGAAVLNFGLELVLQNWPAAIACLLLGLGFALLAFPARKPNAIYLRAFKTDKSTSQLRRRLASALGPKFRLAGIRPPRERSRSFLRFIFPTLIAFRYTGSTYMELEAGDDWMQRLWATYRTTRVVFIDIRETTSYVHEEIQMTVYSLGPSRCIFLVDESEAPRQAWFDLLGKVMGQAFYPEVFELLDVSEDRRHSGEMDEDLKTLVAKLPPLVSEESLDGWAFTAEHGKPGTAEPAFEKPKRRWVWPVVAVVVLGTAVLGYLDPMYLLVEAMVPVGIASLAIFVLFVGVMGGALYRMGRSAWEMGRAGYRGTSVLYWSKLLTGALLVAGGSLAVFASAVDARDRAENQQRNEAMIQNGLSYQTQQIYGDQTEPSPAMQVDMPEFRYESDTGLTDATEATRKAIEDGKAPGAVPDCPNIAFEGTSTSGAEYRETGLMTFGSKCADEWTTAVLDMYVAGMSTNALPTGTHVGRPVNYQLAGHRAAVLNSRMARGDGGQPRYRTLSCALLGGKMDCWIFVADKCDDLHAMAQTKVTFRGHEPTEVVPVDSLPECK